MARKVFLILVFLIVHVNAAVLAAPPRDNTLPTLGYSDPRAPITPVQSPFKSVFQWTAVKAAKNYKLWIEVDGEGPQLDLVTPKDAGCVDTQKNSICSREIELKGGVGTWWIRAEADKEVGPWRPQSFKEPLNRVDRCIMPTPLTGDIPGLWNVFGNGEWSVGPAISAQTVKYDFATKKAGFNTGLGVGAAFRFYTHVPFQKGETLKNKVGPKIYKKFKKLGKHRGQAYVPISYIKEECRAQNLSRITNETIASPLFSITPTIYIAEPTDTSDLRVEPALMFGAFRDIVNIGVGFNLTGREGEVGDVFLLFSLGTGFNF